MENKDDLKSVIENHLLSQLFAILSTQAEVGTHSVIVSYIVTNGIKELVFVTPQKTRKYQNLIDHPLVSLYIDNRTNSLEDLHKLTGVEIIGRAAIAGSEDRAYYRSLFVSRFPELTDFYDSPDNAVIKVSISRFELIDDFQNTRALEML